MFAIEQIGPIVGALMALFLYSRLLYKETPLFKIANATMLGTGAAYWFVISIKSIRDMAIYPLLEGKYILIIPIVLGLLLYTQLNVKTQHISRIPIAVLLGVGAALTLRAALLRNLIDQFRALVLPLTGVSPLTLVNNIIIIIGTITTITYFIMSKEHKGNLGIITRIGRLFLMVAFGAYFGTQVLTRHGILSGVIENILSAFGLLG